MAGISVTIGKNELNWIRNSIYEKRIYPSGNPMFVDE
jgi:hypothetical protein